MFCVNAFAWMREQIRNKMLRLLSYHQHDFLTWFRWWKMMKIKFECAPFKEWTENCYKKTFSFSFLSVDVIESVQSIQKEGGLFRASVPSYNQKPPNRFPSLMISCRFSFVRCLYLYHHHHHPYTSLNEINMPTKGARIICFSHQKPLWYDAKKFSFFFVIILNECSKLPD